MEKINFITFPVGTVFFKTNCYIVFGGDDCVVIDPGFCPQAIIERLEELGHSPSYILLTHGHDDHIGGVKALKKRYGSVVAIGSGDAYRLKYPADRLLYDGDIIQAGSIRAKVISSPGHTEGGLCFIIEDHLFSGDTLFCDDIGRTDLPGGDFDTLLESLRKLSQLSGDYIVCPGHEEPTTLSHERSCNRYMR